MKKRKKLLLACSLSFAVLLFAITAGCASQPTTGESSQNGEDFQATNTGQSTAETTGNTSTASDEGTETTTVYAAPETDPMNPLVTTLEDGTIIQRTPTEGSVYTALDGSYTYHTPAAEDTVPYNTYYLDADRRGCYACHDNLADTLANMKYQHVDLRNSYGIQITVDMCIDCHTYGWVYLTNQNSFGTLIHGIHDTEKNGDCWSCHVGTGSGDGMQVWDLVKYEELRGITPVADVKGDFSFNQDKTITADEMFDFDWLYYDWDYTRHENTVDKTPLDEKTYNDWTITITGAVDHDVTYTLPELVEKFGTVEIPATLACTLNPTGGPLIGNAVYTGVPLSAIFKDAGISPDAGGFTSAAPDGFIEPVIMDENYQDAYLAVKLGGESLPWNQGYPVQLVVPGSAAPAWVKEVSEIVVVPKDETAELNEWNGWPVENGDAANVYTPEGWPYTHDNGYQNKPNVALFDFTEGQVIKTGEPYTFTGYADSYNQRITGIEFSLDGGATWTHFDTPDTKLGNWVIWDFTYTPDTDSAYVMKIRSVNESGAKTPEPITVLFNAQSDL